MMGFSLRMSQSLEQSLEQRLACIQAQKQECAQLLAHVRGALGLDTDDLAPVVFETVALLASDQIHDVHAWSSYRDRGVPARA